MTAATAVKKAPTASPAAKPAAAPDAPPPPFRRRGVTPLTPMRQETAKRIRKLAGQVQQSHPDMTVHDHLRDAARVLESGNEEGAQRHLRAAMFALTPQSLMRNGLHTDDSHQAARDAMHGVHRHLLLVKDITDAAAKNQQALRRDSYGDDSTSNPPPKPAVQADPNAGYGPGALAQKPTARQPPGNQAMNAPARSNGGGSDPAAADPVGPQPRGSKQFATRDGMRAVTELAYDWNDLASVIGQIELASSGGHHIAGTDYDWKHNYIPLTHAAAQSHFKGNVPKSFHAPSAGSKAPRAKTAATGKPTAHKAAAAETASRPATAKAAAGPQAKLSRSPAAGNDKQLSLIGERMTGGDKTSGEMKAGDMQEGHQAIAQAPVGILGNEKQRTINGGYVKGSFSDPWWMAGPGGKFAVSQRWKSPAQTSHQKINGEWKDVKLPAKDERVLTPWSASAGKARTLADRLGSEHSAAAGHLRDASVHIALGNSGKAEESLRAAQSRLSGSHKSIAAYAAKNPSPEASRMLKETEQHIAAVSALRGQGGSTAALAWTREEFAAALVELSAQTAALERTPAPRGKPGGPGLYDVEGMGHTPYLQQVVKALIGKRGMDPHRAYAVARGAIRKWGRGGGHVHPEVQAAASKAESGELARQARAKAVHGHAVSWDDIGADIELATVLEFFNPAQARLPVGPGGGQFAGGGAQPAGAQGQQPAGKQAPAQTPAQKAAAAAAAQAKAAHAAHVAHVAHVNGVSTQKAELMVTAQNDRQKAAGLIKQRDALLKALQSAAGKTSTGQAGAKTATTAKTKSTAPAKSSTAAASTKAASTTAKTTTAKSSTTAAKKTTAKAASATAAASSTAGSAAAMKAQVAQLNTQINNLLAQAKQAETQAATMK